MCHFSSVDISKFHEHGKFILKLWKELSCMRVKKVKTRVNTNKD